MSILAIYYLYWVVNPGVNSPLDGSQTGLTLYQPQEYLAFYWLAFTSTHVFVDSHS